LSLRPYALAALGLAAYLLFLAATIPASLVAAKVQQAAPGRVVVHSAQGTLWRGTARATVSALPAAPVVVETIEWRFLPANLAAGQLAFAIRANAAGLTLEGDAAKGFSGWQVSTLKAQGEARALTVFAPIAAPWQPGGTIALTASRLAWDGRDLHGDASLEWRAAATSLSEVRPLGTYRAELHAEGTPAKLTIATLEGPLTIKGTGTLSPAGTFTFSGEARPDAASAKALEPLLNLLGPKRADGANTIAWSLGAPGK
jgi:general secretion pathway protein N